MCQYYQNHRIVNMNISTWTSTWIRTKQAMRLWALSHIPSRTKCGGTPRHHQCFTRFDDSNCIHTMNPLSFSFISTFSMLLVTNNVFVQGIVRYFWYTTMQKGLGRDPPAHLTILTRKAGSTIRTPPTIVGECNHWNQLVTRSWLD